MRISRAALAPVLAALLLSCGSGASTTADLAAGGPATTAQATVDTQQVAVVPVPSGSAAIAEVPSAVSTGPAVTEPAALEPAATEPAGDGADTLDTVVAEPQFSGDGSSRFCDLIRELDESSPLDAAFGNSSTPEATKANWDRVMAVFGPLQQSAPDEIAADVAVATRFIGVMDRIFVENDYDMVEIASALEADPVLVALGDADPVMDAATARLDAYGVQVCGLAS